MDLEIFTQIWGYWLDLFASVPYWDPFGAVVALIAIIFATGGLLRLVFR